MSARPASGLPAGLSQDATELAHLVGLSGDAQRAFAEMLRTTDTSSLPNLSLGAGATLPSSAFSLFNSAACGSAPLNVLQQQLAALQQSARLPVGLSIAPHADGKSSDKADTVQQSVLAGTLSSLLANAAAMQSASRRANASDTPCEETAAASPLVSRSVSLPQPQSEPFDFRKPTKLTADCSTPLATQKSTFAKNDDKDSGLHRSLHLRDCQSPEPNSANSKLLTCRNPRHFFLPVILVSATVSVIQFLLLRELKISYPLQNAAQLNTC